MAVFPVFLKLEGRRVLVVGAGPVAAGKLRPLLDAGARVTVVAPDVVDEIAAMAPRGGDRPPPVRARRRRRRVVCRRGGAARREPRGRARGRVALPLRERGGRSGERERVCRRDRAEGGRDDRHVDRRRSAGARRPSARGARGAAARRSRRSGWRARRRHGADGSRRACRWPSGGRCCSQALNEFYERKRAASDRAAKREQRQRAANL